MDLDSIGQKYFHCKFNLRFNHLQFDFLLLTYSNLDRSFLLFYRFLNQVSLLHTAILIEFQYLKIKDPIIHLHFRYLDHLNCFILSDSPLLGLLVIVIIIIPLSLPPLSY